MANANTFVQSMYSALCQYAAPTNIKYDEKQFRFIIQGRSGTQYFNLDNAFYRFKNAPAHRQPAILDHYAQQVVYNLGLPATFAEAAPYLMPCVRPKAFLEFEHLEQEAAGHPADKLLYIPSIPLSPHLCVALGYDLPDSILYVDSKTLARWNIGLEEAITVATENLKQMPIQIENGPDSAPGVFFITRNDYAISHLVSDTLFQLPIQGQPVVLAPDRNVVYVTGSENVKGITTLFKLAVNLFDNNKYTMPLVPLAFTDAGWQVISLSDPHIEQNQLALMYHWEYTDYKKQTQLLEQIYQRQRRPIDVLPASITILDNMLNVTICHLEPTRHEMLIPLTHTISFVLDGKTVCADWEIVQRHLKTRWTPVSIYPKRFHAARYPSEEELRAIARSGKATIY